MKKPSMIIFDYGQTLADEPSFDLSRGLSELYKHIVKNPDNITLQQFADCDGEIFKKHNAARKAGYEPHFHAELRCLLGYIGLELDVSFSEAERILWDNTSIGRIKPYADELLNYLEESSIRYGIVSNIGWSGKALSDRMNRLFPVLYEDNSCVSPWAGQNDGLYGSAEYLHIHDWRELIEELKSCD